MNSQEVQESFKKYNEFYGKFNSIENKLHFNKKLCAMLKIASLFEDPLDFEFSAHHEELHLGFSSCITEADVLYLTKCGVWYDPTYDDLCIFM